MKQVEFYFDVGSPYSYLAYHQLQKIAAARSAQIVWRPMLLGAVFKATGNSSPIAVPAKGRHAMVDLMRWSKHFDVPLRMNPHFPINTLALMRVATGLQMRDQALFERYLTAIFSAMFEQPLNLNQPAEIAAALEGTGVSAADFEQLAQDEAVKAKLKQDTEEAVARGVFGAPTFFIGKDMYWGQDRLHFVDQALAG